MSRAGDVTFVWGDGEHRFRLGLGELRELQEKCGAGPWEIAERLRGMGIPEAPMYGVRARVDDVRETIRLGLIGGGMSPTDALALVGRYVDGRPLEENRTPALLVMLAALVGAPDEPAKKDAGPETIAATAPQETTESSASARSTPPVH